MSFLSEGLSHSATLGAASARRARVVANLKSLVASLTRRKAIRDLSRLDDRMLSDMGLTRSDLAATSRWSLWGDPTDRLTEVAEERRAARDGWLGVG